MINQDRVVEEFLRLARIDSPSMQEREIADYLARKMAGLGLQVTEDQAGEAIGSIRSKKTGKSIGSNRDEETRKAIGNIRSEHTGNLIGVFPGNLPGAPTVLFCAHMDTVEPGRGVKPVIREKTIYSDGSTILGADDKAGIAALLEAVEVLKEQRIPHGDLEIVFTVAEEGGLWGAKNLDYQRLKAKIGYVLDGDGPAGTIITKAPSQYKIKAAIIGKAAHAGISPEEGINAILVASRAISKMRLGRIDEETTANIGVISGGQATNIIPDLVNIEGETRSIDPVKLEAQTDLMVRILDQTAGEMGAQAKIEKEFLYPRLKLEESDQAVRIAVAAARGIGREPVLVSTGGGSDANILNGFGIPTANLGIGMNKVHSTEEFITIDNMVLDVKYILEIVQTAARERV